MILNFSTKILNLSKKRKLGAKYGGAQIMAAAFAGRLF
jgi:hypothetical protein